MFKKRLLTASILIPIVILAIFFLPPLFFLFLVAVVILFAGWEWTDLAEIKSTTSKFIYEGILLVSLILSLWIPLFIVVLIGVLGWLFALALVIAYPRLSSWWGKGTSIRAAMGIFVLILFWLSLIILQGFSPIVLVFVLFLIWGMDTGAYLVGKKWGQHKLLPSVSPGKTVEGLLGGLMLVLLLALVGYWLLQIPSSRGIPFILFCLLGGLVSVLGDLFESMLKRHAHIKDSGNWLPGHGGILDRIDSLTTALPFFAMVFPYFLSM